jgi:hypothetical protein
MPQGENIIPDQKYEARRQQPRTDEHTEIAHLLIQLKEKNPSIFRHILGVIRAVVKT